MNEEGRTRYPAFFSVHLDKPLNRVFRIKGYRRTTRLRTIQLNAEVPRYPQLSSKRYQALPPAASIHSVEYN